MLGGEGEGEDAGTSGRAAGSEEAAAPPRSSYKVILRSRGTGPLGPASANAAHGRAALGAAAGLVGQLLGLVVVDAAAADALAGAALVGQLELGVAVARRRGLLQPVVPGEARQRAALVQLVVVFVVAVPAADRALQLPLVVVVRVVVVVVVVVVVQQPVVVVLPVVVLEEGARALLDVLVQVVEVGGPGADAQARLPHAPPEAPVADEAEHQQGQHGQASAAGRQRVVVLRRRGYRACNNTAQSVPRRATLHGGREPKSAGWAGGFRDAREGPAAADRLRSGPLCTRPNPKGNPYYSLLLERTMCRRFISLGMGDCLRLFEK